MCLAVGVAAISPILSDSLVDIGSALKTPIAMLITLVQADSLGIISVSPVFCGTSQTHSMRNPAAVGPQTGSELDCTFALV